MSIIQSAGGIIYYIESDKSPRFLIIKRHAMSGKIEWVAPKGKIQKGETPDRAAIREVGEETGIPSKNLVLEEKIGATKLRTSREMKGGMDKDVTYFLMRYTGNPDGVSIQPVEGYLGIYKRATLEEVVGLIYYKNFRELFIAASSMIRNTKYV